MTAPTTALVSAEWGFNDPMQVTRDIVCLLDRAYGIVLVGELRGALLVEPSFRDGEQPPVYALHDNGGEITVRAVNGAATESVGVTEWHRSLSASTIAYRLSCAMRGIQIDRTFVGLGIADVESPTNGEG